MDSQWSTVMVKSIGRMWKYSSKWYLQNLDQGYSQEWMIQQSVEEGLEQYLFVSVTTNQWNDEEFEKRTIISYIA